jgi:hypothetical protein
MLKISLLLITLRPPCPLMTGDLPPEYDAVVVAAAVIQYLG